MKTKCGEKMDSLLLEIVAEEIPAGYIEPALSALSSNLLKTLDEKRISYGEARTFGTPKRLAIYVTEVSDKQEAKTEEVTGPPEKVAFSEDGTPQVPAVKFAEKVGIPVEDIQIKETKKGRYLYAMKEETVLETPEILKEILPKMILSIPFPKTMRWADLDILFARPIKSILALYGNEVIPFKHANIESGPYTFGHRFMAPGKIKIENPEIYIDTLRRAYVIANIEERKKRVKEDITKAAESVNGHILPDDELEDIVTNLIEFPAVVAGSFDDDFLQLPNEILITAMREHQKYFAAVDKSGNLLPHFIVVNNTKTRDMSVVTKGHEKVLRARLADAAFFYNADLNVPPEERVKKLEGVLFQAQLGTMLEKTERIKELSSYIAEKAGADEATQKNAVRAAGICKSDLVSHVVVEFPKLQGVMGRIYAQVKGEPDSVAKAIEEHYRPTHSGGKLPDTDTGAILAIADKIDTICGCFYAGMVPTGASDPYALRRQSIGIAQIMIDNTFGLSLDGLIDKGLSLYAKDSDTHISEVSEAIYSFIRSRMSHLLFEEGFSKDVIQSVVTVSAQNVPQVWERVKALEALKSDKDFEPIGVAFKRVVNIIKKAEIKDPLSVNLELFQDESESALYDAFLDTRNKVDDHLKKGDFGGALSDIASMREPVDLFFDKVMVMADDENIKNNRLALLQEISALFGNIADFSLIATK